MPLDIIHNGQAFGDVASRLLQSEGDYRALRPYIGDDNQNYISVNTGTDAKGKPIEEAVLTANAATLRKDEWASFDKVVIRAARQRLRAYADLRNANTFGGFDGMSSLVLEHETMSDPGEAFVDFDGMTEGRRDAPLFQLEGLPLPIVHSPFWFSSRRLLVSRKLGTPIDTAMGESAGRRVAEEIEKMTLGTLVGPSLSPTSVAEYGSVPKVYGYTNFPDRVTKIDFTAPTAGGWTPAQAIDDILDLIDSLNDNNFYGPFKCYHSTDWSKHMDIDYSAEKGDNTLRDRIGKLDQIIGKPIRLDFLPNTFTILLVQMTPDVCRAVNGMEIRTVQWSTMGGMRLDFSSDYNGNTGIGHGTTS